ncbi:hypothetical protein SLEP1_g51066 [Rubroshorea leprosula]|uniref:HMA domain-containing protein n=1 Tax=Rubroshorea leprosula TaxID=152421 RepID=A0AAV5M3G2_9ROSI|nr:hypothetical protein SLEP1_g51066 [Rubroshorea leprosula]
MRCGLNVNIQSSNWYSDLKQILKSIKGIKYIIDAEKGTAIVEGRVNPNTILTKLENLKENTITLAWIETGNQKICFSGYETYQYHHRYPYHGGGYWPPGNSLYDPYYCSSSSYGSVAPCYEPYGYWPITSGWRY